MSLYIVNKDKTEKEFHLNTTIAFNPNNIDYIQADGDELDAIRYAFPDVEFVGRTMIFKGRDAVKILRNTNWNVEKSFLQTALTERI